MVRSRGPQWICCAKVCMVTEEHTALSCYRFPCPLWRSWRKRLTVLTHLFLSCPFLKICNRYRPSGLLIRQFHFALMTPCFTCRVRKLANGCCSFVFMPCRRDNLEDLHNFLGSQPKWWGKGIKYTDFLPPKMALKILPGSASLCPLTASSKFLQLSYFPTPENAAQLLNY